MIATLAWSVLIGFGHGAKAVVGFLARHLNLSPGNGAFEMVTIVVGVVALGLIAKALFIPRRSKNTH